MFGKLFKAKDPALPSESATQNDSAQTATEPPIEPHTASDSLKDKPNQQDPWQVGLQRTNQGLGQRLRSLLLGRKGLDDELREELEMQLIAADVGLETTGHILDLLDQAISQSGQDKPAIDELSILLETLLKGASVPMHIPKSERPFVVMVVGVNGVGKTTSIGKITHSLKSEGKSVVLAAGDTFRAAAIDQLQVWGDRNEIPVVAQKPGSDSASVIFDALQSATNRKADVLIADTAGRLHNKGHLMAELEKVVRVIKKLDEKAPHEVLLVLDASTGQNALNQAKEFSKVAPITGLVITKLDGTARGGVVLALAHQLGLPVRFIGLGEGIEDLRPFEAKSFVSALLQENSP